MKKGGATVISLDELEDRDDNLKIPSNADALFKPRPISRATELPEALSPLDSPKSDGSRKGYNPVASDDYKKEPQLVANDGKKRERNPSGGKKKEHNPVASDGSRKDQYPMSTIPGSVPPHLPTLVRVKTPDIKGEKDLALTECPFSDFGCDMHGEAINVRRHIRDESALHLQQMCVYVLDLANQTKDAVTITDTTFKESEDTVRRVRQIGSLYSSQFIWHINGYAEAFANARRGRPAIIYSTPFQSHRQGYKLAAAMALYGDGDAIGEFNSVFVTILRGDYDAILPWPFSCPITFTLVNLKGGENVETTVTPRLTENNMPFLGRPHSDRNPAFGIKSFTDLRMMEDNSSFVQNDVCFLKVDIDLTPIYRR